MSLVDYQIADVTVRLADSSTVDTIDVVSQISDITVRISDPFVVDEIEVAPRDVLVIAAGNVGPRGPAGKWEALTQNEYDLLNPPDPDTLYVIIQ